MASLSSRRVKSKESRVEFVESRIPRAAHASHRSASILKCHTHISRPSEALALCKSVLGSLTDQVETVDKMHSNNHDSHTCLVDVDGGIKF